MKRLSFLAALLGLPALAQTKKQDASTSGLTLPCWGDSHGGGCTYGAKSSRLEVKWGAGYPDQSSFLNKAAPLNNECPVCGTMAEPFIPKFPSGGECGVFDEKDGWKPCGPLIQLARCKQCNCGFWQDAEK